LYSLEYPPILAGVPPDVVRRAREILFNLEKKELDAEGVPKIAYRSEKKRDRSQYLLFAEDREQALLSQIKEDIQKLDLNAITPLDALAFLSELKEAIQRGRK
jgi:DNA mismatch repair protein MutS